MLCIFAYSNRMAEIFAIAGIVLVFIGTVLIAILVFRPAPFVTWEGIQQIRKAMYKSSREAALQGLDHIESQNPKLAGDIVRNADDRYEQSKQDLADVVDRAKDTHVRENQKYTLIGLIFIALGSICQGVATVISSQGA